MAAFRVIRGLRPGGVLLGIALLATATTARAITVPGDFAAQNVMPGVSLDLPTSIAFLPDGRMLVGEKRGRVWLVTNGVPGLHPLWQGEAEVLNENDSGLLDVAVDPHYFLNHYIYLLYTVDPDSDGVDDNTDAFGRLTRYQVGWNDSSVVDSATRTVLFGTSWRDAPLTGSITHGLGALRWGRDGTLLVSAGEGSHYDQADAGGLDSAMFTPDRADTAQDIGAYRAQWIHALSGKILRIDPVTGQGLPSNPYWTGDPDDAASKVWAYGLRNPFRFSVEPGTGSDDPIDGNPGVLYIGDVGWATWEELDVARQSGLNFGWPCFEGFAEDTVYDIYGPQPNRAGCSSVGTPENPAQLTAPLLVTNHQDALLSVPPGASGNCIIVGGFVTSPGYPDAYQGVWLCDYGTGSIRILHPSPGDGIVSIDDFATGADGPVDMQIDPLSGDPVYVAINIGQIIRLHYTGGPDQPPVPLALASPSAGPAPLVVAFSSESSSDPDGDALSFGWSFGDGQGSTLPNPVHSYATPGSYNAILTANDRRGGVTSDTTVVLVTESTAFPATLLMDNFGRADGPLGGPWSHASPQLVIRSTRMTESTDDPAAAVWPEPAGPSQEAWMRVTTLSSTAARQALILKLQGGDTTADHVEMRYDASRREVRLNLFTAAGGMQTFAGPWTVRLRAGDQIGARAYANGRVEAYRNSALIGAGTLPSTWPGRTAAGGIGFALTGASAARHDDFGGGTLMLTSNTPPNAIARAPHDSSFYIAADTIRLVASGADAQDDSTRLAYHWDVLLHHNNHIHPVLEADSAVATYLGENHDDGTGVWIDNRLIVTDTGGLSDTTDVHLFPEIDLRPEAAHSSPSTPGTTAPALYRFVLHNDGRMPAPLSHWVLRGDNTVLAQGDTLVGARDSLTVLAWGPPALPAGSHVLRVTADTLSATPVVETNEANNAAVRTMAVVDGPGPDEFPPMFIGAPGTEPSDTWALVRWTNDEPTTGVVRFGATPALGDSSAIDSIAVPSLAHTVTLAGLHPSQVVYFRIAATDAAPARNTAVSALDSLATLAGPLAVGEQLPQRLALSSASPNPMRAGTALALALPTVAREVRFEVLDVAGRVVWSASPRSYAAGNWPLAWPGMTRRGRVAEPGLYLMRVTVDASPPFVRRVVVLR